MTPAWVMHVDLDEFIAAVEMLRSPELRGRPVIVGGHGDPSQRGVVATASYEARRYGAHSGMPLRTAARKCPEAVFLPVDATAYNEASEQVMAVLRSLNAVVEVLGWDEAFLGVETDDPEAFATDIQAAVLDATGLHCSIGIGDNKLRAKIATEYGKPRGRFRLTADNWYEVMADRPVDALWGIGAKTAKRLAALGITTVGELSRTKAQDLADRLGPTMGPWYRRLARGVDTSPVDATPYQARSHGRETTFQRNLTDWGKVAAEVRALAETVADDVRREGRPATRVTVKVRYAPFETRSRSTPLNTPTLDSGTIADASEGLLDRFDTSRHVRLVGVNALMAEPDVSAGSAD